MAARRSGGQVECEGSTQDICSSPHNEAARANGSAEIDGATLTVAVQGSPIT